ncbi:MAG TPA: redoxin domain-containing protein [Verrucomicrobiae bacterium]|nr:redoxin domain-containing protein [Verrucomicrobiae bacterium]
MNRLQISLRAGGWLGGLAVAALLLAVPVATAAGVPNFTLMDFREQNQELRRADGKAVVLFFTGNGCPIAAKSVPKLRALKSKFGKEGITFWVINAYPDDTLQSIREERNKLKMTGFQILRDTKLEVALSLGVERTAEVVAISTSDWKVFYQGAIDDQYTEGAERPAPQSKFLETALRQFLAGQPIETTRTASHGCRLPYAGIIDTPSYAAQVAPILRGHCVQCHREGGIGQWEMNGYGPVKNKARMIEEVLLTRRMPPWDPSPDYGHFADGNSLSPEEAQTLLAWVKAGAPRGEGEDPLTAKLDPLPDWELGTPNAVVRLAKEQQIPATGVLDYRQLPLTSPGLTNEVWLRAVTLKPGNRKVVHHAIIYAKWPGCVDNSGGKGVFIAGWAPGVPSLKFPEGVGKRLPANAELSVEMHYTTCGTDETDVTQAAFYYWPGPQARSAETRAALDLDLMVPPGTDEARHHATYCFNKPATIYGLSPHMHKRGKWMRYELLLPDGTKETLLHVPRYDFNWQHTYRFAEPRHVQPGTWLLVSGAFDNSDSNPANPDSRERVRFGQQSWDEMFIGFFEAADDPATGTASIGSSGGAGGQP